RRSFAEHRHLDELLVPPGRAPEPARPLPPRRRVTDARRPGPHVPEPVAEWHRADVRSAMAAAVDRALDRPAVRLDAVVGGRRVGPGDDGAGELVSTDPSDPSRVVARAAAATEAHADEAVAAARAAF